MKSTRMFNKNVLTFNNEGRMILTVREKDLMAKDADKVIITFQGDKAMLEKLKEIAKFNHSSVSWVVRRYVEEGMDEYQSSKATIGDSVKGRNPEILKFEVKSPNSDTESSVPEN